MRRPFLPILPFLIRYPFLSYAEIFKFDRNEILSDLSGAAEKVKNILDGKIDVDSEPLEFLCSNCVEKEECSGFDSCDYPIQSVEYLRLQKLAKDAVLNWKRCMVVVSNLDDVLRRKFAVRMARAFREMLKKECDDFIFVVAKDFGVRFDGFSVDFRDYLKGAIKIKSDDWKLVNRKVVGGFVQLTRDEFVRLLEEFIKDRLMEKVPIKVNVDFGIKREIKLENIPINFECFPECMKKILAELDSGKNVPHTGRFAIASFLINLGYDVDKVVEVFRNAPDFDEEKTRYQVEHIAGMRGKGERYIAPSCETMKSWGLCIWNCDVNHPITFYWRCVRGSGSGKGSSKRKGNP